MLINLVETTNRKIRWHITLISQFRQDLAYTYISYSKRTLNVECSLSECVRVCGRKVIACVQRWNCTKFELKALRIVGACQNQCEHTAKAHSSVIWITVVVLFSGTSVYRYMHIVFHSTSASFVLTCDGVRERVLLRNTHYVTDSNDYLMTVRLMISIQCDVRIKRNKNVCERNGTIECVCVCSSFILRL